MDNFRDYQGLRFTRRVGRIPGRLAAIGAALIVFTLLWFLLPTSLMYWLLLLGIAMLVWVSTYGWRAALTNFIHFLRTLEDM